MLTTFSLPNPHAMAAVRAVADCRERVELADGRRVIVCPVDPRDAPAEQAFIGALSQDSRYRRFHFGLRELPPDMLRAMTEIDQRLHVALVARNAAAPGTLVADARYVRDEDDGGDSAEFAVAIADAWQGAGLGREMLRRLAVHAGRHGVRRIHGDVLWGNEPMLALVRGRVYYNLLNWYRTLALLPGFQWNRAFMERMMGVREALVFASEGVAYLKVDSARFDERNVLKLLSGEV